MKYVNGLTINAIVFLQGWLVEYVSWDCARYKHLRQCQQQQQQRQLQQLQQPHASQAQLRMQTQLTQHSLLRTMLLLCLPATARESQQLKGCAGCAWLGYSAIDHDVLSRTPLADHLSRPQQLQDIH